MAIAAQYKNLYQLSRLNGAHENNIEMYYDVWKAAVKEADSLLDKLSKAKELRQWIQSLGFSDARIANRLELLEAAFAEVYAEGRESVWQDEQRAAKERSDKIKKEHGLK